jgi:hypothetical protein
MDKEFKLLKKRYNLSEITLRYDSTYLKKGEHEAVFFPEQKQIVLLDRRVCRRRLLSLLHEIKHVLQFKEGRLVRDFRSLRKMYFLEFEAEMFSINEYEELYAKKYGSCLHERWTLATFEEYKNSWLC